MSSLTEYFPQHVWVTIFGFALLAVAGIFVPPSLTASLGLSLVEHIVAIGVVQFSAAVGISGLVVAYRDQERDDSEWRFDP